MHSGWELPVWQQVLFASEGVEEKWSHEARAGSGAVGTLKSAPFDSDAFRFDPCTKPKNCSLPWTQSASSQNHWFLKANTECTPSCCCLHFPGYRTLSRFMSELPLPCPGHDQLPAEVLHWIGHGVPEIGRCRNFSSPEKCKLRQQDSSQDDSYLQQPENLLHDAMNSFFIANSLCRSLICLDYVGKMPYSD